MKELLPKNSQQFDMVSDDSGKRYLLAPLDLMLNDVEGAYIKEI
jgi:hypothetical protein